MTDQPSGAVVTSKLAGWLKGLFTTVFGLCSGAVLMYASPLIDRIVKPAKPVANFAAQAQGLQVTFQNRSTGGTEGWWDFGDGAALEPYIPSQGTLPHTYARAGVYTAKLSLKNLLGDENDRTVNVNVDAPTPTTPTIDAFAVIPISPQGFAPATFRVVSKIKNADTCVWALGENRKLEVSADIESNQDRIVTFERPGKHAIRLAVFNGKQAIEKSETVEVAKAAPAGTATAVLKVTREAVQVVTTDRMRVVPVQFPANSRETVVPLDKTIAAADHGCRVIGVQVVSAANASGVKAEVTPDGQQIRLTGQLVRQTSWFKIPLKATPQAVIALAVKQEQVRPATTHTPDMVAGTLTVPGSASLAVPRVAAGWAMKKQVMTVEVHDGDKVVWQTSQVPASGTVTLQNRPCLVTATLVGDQVQVALTTIRSGATLGPLGN